MIKGRGRPPGGPDSVFPSPQASLVMCPVPASSSAPAFLCSPTGHCRNLDRCTQGTDPRRIPDISLHFLGPTLRTWAFYLIMGAMCQVWIAPEGTGIFLCVEWVEVVLGAGTNRYGGGRLGSCSSAFSLGRERAHTAKLGPDFGGLRH